MTVCRCPLTVNSKTCAQPIDDPKFKDMPARLARSRWVTSLHRPLIFRVDPHTCRMSDQNRVSSRWLPLCQARHTEFKDLYCADCMSATTDNPEFVCPQAECNSCKSCRCGTTNTLSHLVERTRALTRGLSFSFRAHHSTSSVLVTSVLRESKRPVKPTVVCRSPSGEGTGLMVISLGDEISMTGTPECLSDTSFSAFLKAKHIMLSTVGCISYTTCKMLSAVPGAGGSVAPPSNMNSSSALLWYYSQIFTHDCGIANFQNKTIIAKNNSAKITVGANMSPLKNDWGSSTFIGQTFQVCC